MRLIYDGDVGLYLSVARKEPITFQQALDNWFERKERFMENIFATDCTVCLSTDGENFRKINYAWYKEDRKNGDGPPEHLYELKEWLFKNDPDVIGSPGGEADDFLMIEACECYERGELYAIGTVDKDLRTIPGTYYNVRLHEIQHISETQAYDWMFSQFLQGDSGDSIPGIYGIGPKKAQKIIDQCDNYEEVWYAIKEVWQEKKGAEDWEQGFNHAVNGTFIRRYEEDLVPLDFADMSWNDFVPKLRIHLPSNEKGRR